MVLIVGSLNVDLVYTGEKFPQPGETCPAHLEKRIGGKGLNQAIACSRAGCPTMLIGALGKDEYATLIKKALKTERLLYYLETIETQPTGSAGIFVNAEGENMIMVHPGANRFLTDALLKADYFEKTKIAICQFEINPEINRIVVREAHKRGITSIVNPAPMDETQLDVIEMADIIVPNTTEFSRIVQARGKQGYGDFTENQIHALSDERLHDLCQSLNLKTIVLTLGARGCFVSNKDGFRMIKAYNVDPVLDTVGAGDAFIGGLATGLILHDGDIFEAAIFGNAAAALAIGKKGAATAMPTKKEIVRFMTANHLF